MKRDPIQADVLATKIIPNVSPDMAKELNLEPGMKSLALITSNCDDVTYTALDEATKKQTLKLYMQRAFTAALIMPTRNLQVRSSESSQDQILQKFVPDLRQQLIQSKM